MGPEKWNTLLFFSSEMFVLAAAVKMCFSVCVVGNCMWMQSDNIDSHNGGCANNILLFNFLSGKK